MDCGYSEFKVPRSWLSAGWLRSARTQSIPTVAAITASRVEAIAS
jgi:hypothetical protein